ncbi:MAG TPA: DUF2561 family protein [Candidatus Limnocylindria bacterium]|nr:DUF2561 family protein [Candidatus Limnocylindria bacterium]
MPYSVDAVGRSRLSPDTLPGALDRIDRILLGACAAVWLVALGAGVAASVALVDLGRGHPIAPEGSDTPWLLYAVIGISAVVIVGAVPLLLRARRTALDAPRPARTTGERPAPGQPPSARGAEAPTEKLRAFKSVAEQVNPRPGYPAPSAAIRAAPSVLVSAVDQLWLRCAVAIACAMGVATLAIGVATYLMASDNNTAAWILYGLAGLVTLAMPALAWFYLRQLHDVLDA